MNRATKAALGGSISLALLIALEIAARPWAPLGPRSANDPSAAQEVAMRGSPLLGWEAVPGPNQSFGVPRPTHINAQGTRNPELEAKPDGTTRLLTLGDSTVYGVLVGDDEVFSAVAAKRLGERLGRPVEAVNGGIPGYSTMQSLRLFEERLQPVQPDVLLIANLWSDSQSAPQPDEVVYPRAYAGPMGLMQRLAVFRILDGWIHGWRPPVEVKWELTAAEATRVPIDQYAANLRRLVSLAEDRGARPVLLMLPSDRDCTGQALEAPRPAYRDAMRTAAGETGVALIDGAAVFTRQPKSLMADDVHPSRGGHRRLGEAIADQLLPLLSAAAP